MNPKWDNHNENHTMTIIIKLLKTSRGSIKKEARGKKDAFTWKNKDKSYVSLETVQQYK